MERLKKCISFTKYLKTTPDTSFYRFAAFLDAKEVQRQACHARPFNFAVILRNKTQHSRRMPAKDACCSFRFLFSNLSIFQRWNCRTPQNYAQLFFLFLLIIFLAPGGARNCKFVIAICLHWRGREIALNFMLGCSAVYSSAATMSIYDVRERCPQPHLCEWCESKGS